MKPTKAVHSGAVPELRYVYTFEEPSLEYFECKFFSQFFTSQILQVSCKVLT